MTNSSDAATIDPSCAEFSNAEMGAFAHLYRAEVYRSTIWRTRLDATTNWAVVSLGLALSLSYSSPTASPIPLMLVGALLLLFLFLEARRYRYFNVWRARARWIEVNFYAPLLQRQSYVKDSAWLERLAEDYQRPEHHISFERAMGRRLRRNYGWVFMVQGGAYFGKMSIHPTPHENWGEFVQRLELGMIPGWLMLAISATFYMSLFVFTLWMYILDRKRFQTSVNPISMG